MFLDFKSVPHVDTTDGHCAHSVAKEMNGSTYAGLLARLLYRAMLGIRQLGAQPHCTAFGTSQLRDAIQRIYVINLDREVGRWRQMQRELSRVRDSSGKPLSEMARRFAAVDARYFKSPTSLTELQRVYTLADQLFVEPNLLLADHARSESQRIEMSNQEVAVAL